MKIDGTSIVKSLFIITILFIVFAFGTYMLKGILKGNSEESLMIKSNDNLVIELDNNLPLSDKLALENSKETVSGEVFKNIQFEVINGSDSDLNYELYITKEEQKDEIKGKFIKMFLTKGNGDAVSGFNSDSVPSYDKLNAIDDLPGSRILYRGSIKGNSKEKFDFKTWISDSYKKYDKNENFIYKISVRVI